VPSVAVIEAGRTERQYWLDLWCYRELFQVLASQDLAVRYWKTAVSVLWAPALVTVLAFFASVDPSLWIATLNIKYHDFRYVTPFVAQFGLYASPVGFSSSVIPPQWRFLYSLNPIVNEIGGYRWCVPRGQNELYPPGLLVGIAAMVFLLWFAVRRFRLMEKSFADPI
jgi:lipopolysaccharide transport system permease protein